MSGENAARPARFKWSASRLKRLLQCPRQYRYAYVDRLPLPLWAPLAFGACLHETMAKAHEFRLVRGAMPALDVVLNGFDSRWSDLVERGVRFRPSHPAPERYATTGREMLRLWYRQERDIPPPLAVEVPFEFEVEDDAGKRHAVRGVIDRIDEARLSDGHPALAVIDYKSGSRKPAPAELQQDLQFTVYALAVEELLGLPVARIECRTLKDGASLSVERGAPHVERLRVSLSYADACVERNYYPACPGYWCAWCDFKTQCQAEGVAPGQLQNMRPGGGNDGAMR